jgi:16S rRNA U516 pseudouridylate synthase RsuA-like enzyme
MSKKRLQVLLDEGDLEQIRRIAEREGMTVSEWVRRVLRQAGRGRASGDPARKLAAVRSAARHSFPTGDIEQMLDEIERGYKSR